MHHKTKMNLALVITVVGLIGAPALRGEGYQCYPNMPQTRVGHSATLLLNGEVLIVGGVADGTDGKSVLLFSPTHYWSTTNPANEARTKQTATSMPHGRAFVEGGSDTIIHPCT